MLQYFNEHRGTTEYARLLRMFRDVAVGMATLHRAELRHPQLQLSGCLVRRDTSVAIADFGIAEVVDPLPEGTPLMLAEGSGCETDVVLFGLMIAEAVFGVRPSGMPCDAKVRRWFRAPHKPAVRRAGSPLSHALRGWAHPCHIHTRTGLTPATSAPGLVLRKLLAWPNLENGSARALKAPQQAQAGLGSPSKRLRLCGASVVCRRVR